MQITQISTTSNVQSIKSVANVWEMHAQQYSCVMNIISIQQDVGAYISFQYCPIKFISLRSSFHLPSLCNHIIYFVSSFSQAVKIKLYISSSISLITMIKFYYLPLMLISIYVYMVYHLLILNKDHQYQNISDVFYVFCIIAVILVQSYIAYHLSPKLH